LTEHPTDSLLSLYALDPSLVEGIVELEAHLDDCPPCRERLAGIEAADQLIADPGSWSDSETPIPLAAFQVLSAAAARKRCEDEEAETLLKGRLDRFLAGLSSAFVWADIASRPEYRTGGVVRKLADAADKASYNVPRRALILAETASTIVGMLSTTVYTSTEIAALSGLAWKQRANAHRHLGSFAAALEALDRAERAFRELPRPELDCGSITYIRAAVYSDQQRYDLAEQYAAESAAVFAQFGQTELYIRSRYLQGSIAFEQRQLGQAQLIFDSIFEYGETTGDLSWIATTSLALGHCQLERGELSSASQHFHRGMLAFRDLAILSAEIRCRWGLALLVQREGRYRAAIPRLQAVRDEFTNLGAVSDAALVTLDMMETFLLLGQAREVRRTAGNIVKLFKDGGMVTGALTAADYLKQAAAIHGVTPSLLDYIRRYLRLVDVQPDLAFVPPGTL
jgi:tetratricopeptide (TPR) repeat protein